MGKKACPLIVMGAGAAVMAAEGEESRAWVWPLITMADASEAREMVVPETTAVPPGVSVWPGARKNCVAAFAVNVWPPNVSSGISEAPPAPAAAISEVELPITKAVPPGARDSRVPSTVIAGPPA